MLQNKIIPPLAALLVFAHAAAAQELANYRAVYDMEPTYIEQGVKAMPLDGQLAYEVTGSDCKGWTVTSDLVNRATDQATGLRVSEIKSRSFETGDGLTMTVSQQESLNDRLTDDQEIKYTREAVNSEGAVNITGSKVLSFKIPPEALLPTQHQKHLLDIANKGATHDVSLVYDGSDGDKQYRIISLIGPKRLPVTQTAHELSGLSNLASWSFQLGYYPIDDNKSDTPEFQASFIMYENGVSTEMLFDYGTYTMKAKYTHLELLPAPACPSTDKKPQ